MQQRLFHGALEQLALYGEPINQVLEVELEGAPIEFRRGPLTIRKFMHA